MLETVDSSGDLIFFVNGRRVHLASGTADPKCNLLQYVRKIGLTGSKLGCGEGGCGACTVMLSRFNAMTNTVVHCSANACLTPLCSLDGVAVTTVEGIGGMKEGLHPIQQRIASMHGSQCGFCTPGIVMALYTQFRSNPNATPSELESALDGNLCRCTGYRPIIDAARSLSNNKTVGISAVIQGCCRGQGGEGGCPCAAADELRSTTSASGKFSHSSSETLMLSKPSLSEEMLSKNRTEPIFPPALMHYQARSLKLSLDGLTWFQPTSLAQLLRVKAAHPQARLVVGNTEVGIEARFKGQEYDVMVNPSFVPELQVLQCLADRSGVTVGAATTINGFRRFILSLEEKAVSTGEGMVPAHALRGLVAIRQMLDWFASNHIRNVASVGGNIVTASPISDLNPLLLACGAMLKIASSRNGTRELPIKKFFLSYRKVDLHPDEVLLSVFIPYTQEFEFVLPFKQARRREDDISIVTAGLRFALAPSVAPAGTHWAVKDCALAYGGMSATAIVADKAIALLNGAKWSFESFETAISALRTELVLPENVPGGQHEYRVALAASFLFKAYLAITAQLGDHLAALQHAADSRTLPALPVIQTRDASGCSNFITAEKHDTRGEQGYFNRQGEGLGKPYPLCLQDDKVEPQLGTAAAPTDHSKCCGAVSAGKPNGDKGPVGAPTMHKSAEAQVTGAAKYTGDIKLPSDAVHACLVTSTRAHARILNIDSSKAEHCPGFVAFFCAKDVIGSNAIGVAVRDELVFCTDVATCYGAVIGVVVADTHEQAVYAARKVHIDYEDLPAVISIADAIAVGSFFSARDDIISGDLGLQIAEAEVHVTGKGKIGGQEHFYLEPNCSVAIPLEHNKLEIHSSAQDLSSTQRLCASVCGLADNKVVAKCQRMGGGFGGKESRSIFIACTAALAAQLLNRTVSIVIERDVDMSITGQRHAFEYTYRAGMMRDGTLKYLETDMYSNGGCTSDLSVMVMQRALFHVDNSYMWPALTCRGIVCRTNQPSHTAYRGFGGPQGMAIAETVLQHLAQTAGLSVQHLQSLNMYKEGERTHFGQKLEVFYLPTLWEKVLQLAEVSSRQSAIEEFNRNNRWIKRGLAVTPTKFGINFNVRFLNQGGALVHIYTDGSVLIAIGGSEMGQGLHTKMIQVAAQAFGIADTFVSCAETATNTVANASSTAASLSTDLFGMAVLDACEQLLRRMEPVRATMPTASWPELVFASYFERVSLSAHGFYAVDAERCGYDFQMVTTNNSLRGSPMNYFTMGVACTEVEIDCLTGDSRVLRADVLMDVGKSINPALDIGQIEGAFMQGYGWSTMEELIWGDKEHIWVRPGQLFTRGPGTYKIPSFNDVPADFRVHLSDTDNRFAVHSSKAVGEPPFFMGASAFFAIKHAVNAARQERGLQGYFHMDLPATSERIRMACADDITMPQQQHAQAHAQAHAQTHAHGHAQGV